MTPVYIKVKDKSETLMIDPRSSLKEVQGLLRAAAKLNETTSDSLVFKLYNQQGMLIPIGPHIPPNQPNEVYHLKINYAKKLREEALKQTETSATENYKTKEVLDEINEIAEKFQILKAKSEIECKQNVVSVKNEFERIINKPALKRIDDLMQEPSAKQDIFLSQEIEDTLNLSESDLKDLQTTRFDVWKYKTVDEIILILEEIFKNFDLLNIFKIERKTLHQFLRCVSLVYNKNPFHNFRHCLCVTQMMYAILHESEFYKKFSNLEKLTLIISCIGHDLDHPGYNNAYQVNAGTELAIIYNDCSPLENHHTAVLFSILKHDEMNIVKNLSDANSKEFRKDAVNLILATDMGKHGEITSKFKALIESFKIEDENHRKLLLQMIIKCADISNEVRPKVISEPWVDMLLEEFFQQSDKEKSEGLPTAPFMDRQRVTKPSAQVGFIGFVMIPLFELVAKVLPNIDTKFIVPIKEAHQYYKNLLENEKK